MAENAPKVMGWGTIIGILVLTSLALGLTVGLITTALGVSSRSLGAGVGAGVGVVGAILISRRRAALQAQNKG